VSLRIEVNARPKLRYSWLWWTIGWLLVALTINDSLEPSAPKFAHWFPSDKILHFSGYFALAMWFSGITERKRYLFIGFGLISLGGAIEIAQGAMRMGREAEWLDFLANSLGVSIALGLAYAGLGMWMVWVERLFWRQK